MIAVAGSVSLAVAMGIGRFVFDPILPMMLHDRVLGLDLASHMATANHRGYPAGAALSMALPKTWIRGRQRLRRFGPQDWRYRAQTLFSGVKSRRRKYRRPASKKDRVLY
jgi:hypothetical protein